MKEAAINSVVGGLGSYAVPAVASAVVVLVDYWTFTVSAFRWQPTLFGKSHPQFSFLGALVVNELPPWFLPLCKAPLLAFGGVGSGIAGLSFATTLAHCFFLARGSYKARAIANKSVQNFSNQGPLCNKLDGPHNYDSPAQLFFTRSLGGIFRRWHGDSPLKTLTDITYATEQEELDAGDLAKKLRLDILKRKDLPDNASAPVLIYIHGGGWTEGMGDKEEKIPIIYNMAEIGWVVVSINYRLFPNAHWPAYIIDCKRAVRWIKQNISRYGGNPDMIIVSGGSAGGHLASLIALTGDPASYMVPEWQPGFEDFNTAVQGCVAFYPVADTTPEWFCQYTDKKYDIELHKAASPHYRCEEILAQIRDGKLRHELVPFLILQGGSDSITATPMVRAFYEMLNAHPTKSLVEYVEFPGGTHAFDVFASPKSFYANGVAARFCCTIAKSV